MKYVIYFKKLDVPYGWQTRQINEPSRSLQIGQLDLWQSYEIRITAFTIAGEGPQSSPVIVRTGEDSKLYLTVHVSLYFSLCFGYSMSHINMLELD